MVSNPPDKLKILQHDTSTSKINLLEDNLPVPFMSDSFNQGMETSKKNYPTIKNVTRHMEKNHKNETKDTKFVALPIGVIERKILSELLRKKCNLLYLIKKENNMEIVCCPYQKSTRSASTRDYLHFKHCLGGFKKNFLLLFYHLKICF